MDAGLEAELSPLLRLALAYSPRDARPATLSLFLLDTRLSGFVRRSTEPLLAQMRLAWWRDTLGSEPGVWPRGDPLLEVLQGWQAPEGLLALVDGWESLLVDQLDLEAVMDFAGGRVKAWQAFAGEIGVEPAAVDSAARAWALGDLAGNLSEPAERELVVEAAAGEPFVPPRARALRPLAILGGLGRRALSRGGRPLLDGRGAALAALRLGMFGR